MPPSSRPAGRGTGGRYAPSDPPSVGPEEHVLSRTVHLHIGVAKSGTTFLQRILFDNRALLRQHGVLYPGSRRNDHFLASMDLRESTFAGHAYPQTPGAWKRLVSEADGYSGSTLISHETLARSPKSAIRRGVESFGTDDVRIVITARDLARQIPAVWQERIKNRNVDSYGEFLDNIFRSEEGRNRQGGFWLVQDLAGLAGRWAEVVGPERVTIVTVPPSGGDRSLLWRRFSEATGLPDVDYTFNEEGSNPSLGVVESEFLRRLNPRIEKLPWPAYEVRIKRAFAEKTLVNVGGSSRLTVPAEYRDDVRATAEEMIGGLKDAGYPVIGDLDDLRPDLSGTAGPSPDDVTDEELLGLSLDLVGRYATRPAAKGFDRSGLARRAAVRVRDGLRKVRRRG